MMEFPTLVIQLRNDAGFAIDMPDDWLETVMQIATVVHSKYDCGVDVLYGTASKEGFIIIEEEVNKND